MAKSVHFFELNWKFFPNKKYAALYSQQKDYLKDLIGGEGVHLSIDPDDGPGIPRTHLQKVIFEKLTRVEMNGVRVIKSVSFNEALPGDPPEIGIILINEAWNKEVISAVEYCFGEIINDRTGLKQAGISRLIPKKVKFNYPAIIKS